MMQMARQTVGYVHMVIGSRQERASSHLDADRGDRLVQARCRLEASVIQGRRPIVLLVVTVLAVCFDGLVPTSGWSPSAWSTPRCPASLATTIAALPPGSTFKGSGCTFTLPKGLVITKPLTLIGGTYVNPSDSKPRRGDIKPVIKILDTSDVTLSHLHISGANSTGSYAGGSLAKESCITVLSSSHVRLTSIRCSRVFGDGLTLFANFPTAKTPVSDLTVQGYTAKDVGRCGLTPAYVTNSTINDFNVVSSGQASIDAESDLKNVGMGSITFNRLTAHGLVIREFLSGPVTFTNYRGLGGQIVLNDFTNPQPVVVLGGSVALPPNQIGIVQKGGTLSFSGISWKRTKGNKPAGAPAWSVTRSGHLTFINGTPTGPSGTKDSSSTVSIKP
jgi:hypothetical protein